MNSAYADICKHEYSQVLQIPLRSHLNTPKTIPKPIRCTILEVYWSTKDCQKLQSWQFSKLKHATVQQKAPENNQPRLFLSHQETASDKNCYMQQTVKHKMKQ